LTSERDELKKKFEKSVNVIQWSEEDREAKRKEVVRLEAELAELRKDYAVACELIGKAQDERDAATRERDADRATYQNALADHMGERAELQKRVDSLTAYCDDLKSRCDSENLDMNRMQSKLNTLKSNMEIVTAERDKYRKQVADINRHHRELFDQWLGGMVSVLWTSREMYFAEMADSGRRDMCGVDPSTGNSHRAKEQFLQACQRMFGKAGE
jgi:chromosome segregation ATPase